MEENGFIYKISDEFLELMGPVNGLLRSESVEGLKNEIIFLFILF